MIRLNVIGVPEAQGSKSRMPNGAILEKKSAAGRANLAAWRDAVRAVCRAHLEEKPAAALAEPVHVTLHFQFSATKSDPHRFWHASAPDIDKIIRSTFDAMVQGGLLADDRYVCSVAADKLYVVDEPPGVEILVVSRAEDEATKRAERKQRAVELRKQARVDRTQEAC